MQGVASTSVPGAAVKHPLWAVLRLTCPMVLPMWLMLAVLSALACVGGLELYQGLLGFMLYFAVMASLYMPNVIRRYRDALWVLPVPRRHVATTVWVMGAAVPATALLTGYLLAAVYLLPRHPVGAVLDTSLTVGIAAMFCAIWIERVLPPTRTRPWLVTILLLGGTLFLASIWFAILLTGGLTAWSTLMQEPGIALLLLAAAWYVVWSISRREMLVQGLYQRPSGIDFRIRRNPSRGAFQSPRAVVAEPLLLLYAVSAVFGMTPELLHHGAPSFAAGFIFAAWMMSLMSLAMSVFIAERWQTLCLLPLRRGQLVWRVEGIALLLVLPWLAGLAGVYGMMDREHELHDLRYLSSYTVAICALFPAALGMSFYHPGAWAALFFLLVILLVAVVLVSPLTLLAIVLVVWAAGHLFLHWTVLRKKSVHPINARLWRR